MGVLDTEIKASRIEFWEWLFFIASDSVCVCVCGGGGGPYAVVYVVTFTGDGH